VVSRLLLMANSDHRIHYSGKINNAKRNRINSTKGNTQILKFSYLNLNNGKVVQDNLK
jgi:hypothetical protein